MKKLRKNVILGVFVSATLVFAMTVLIVGLVMNIQISRRADSMTDLMVKNNGNLPEKNAVETLNRIEHFDITQYGEEYPYRFRYFSVHNVGTGNEYCELSHIATVDGEAAGEMAKSALEKNKNTGYINGFRYRVSSDGSLAVFLDYSNELNALKQLIFLLILIALFFIVMITLVFYFLSKRIVRPFEENSRMQKQFVTDASHELKTPLAIISANAEVLAYKDGENEWIRNITSQVTRVSELVGELLTLNRLEEVDEITDIEPVDLSEKTRETAAAFDEVIKGKGAELSFDIRPDIIINGNPAQLERLVSVLAENASKYVSENGAVCVSLKKEPRYTHLTVFNTCKPDESIDYSHLFDRFYRPDSSRASKTGGHGIGLSIAKRIVTLHGGTIEAVPQKNGLSFHAKLSNRLKPKTK